MRPDPSSAAAIREAWAAKPGVDAHWESVSGKGVLGRAKTADLLKSDNRLALAAARKIEHPWYRCQALSSVAEACSSRAEAVSLLEEALDAAYAQGEPNRVASVARWPLRLLAKVDQTRAATHSARLLLIIAREPHGLRRLDGLCAILVGVASVESLRGAVLYAFSETAKASFGWRTERIIDLAACELIPFDREAAKALLASRGVTRYTRRSRMLLVA